MIYLYFFYEIKETIVWTMIIRKSKETIVRFLGNKMFLSY